jgi:hypothetical protein
MPFLGLFSTNFSCEACEIMKQQSTATLTIGVASDSLLHEVETKEMSVFHEACVLLKSNSIYK